MAEHPHNPSMSSKYSFGRLLRPQRTICLMQTSQHNMCVRGYLFLNLNAMAFLALVPFLSVMLYARRTPEYNSQTPMLWTDSETKSFIHLYLFIMQRRILYAHYTHVNFSPKKKCNCNWKPHLHMSVHTDTHGYPIPQQQQKRSPLSQTQKCSRLGVCLIPFPPLYQVNWHLHLKHPRSQAISFLFPPVP